MLKRLVIALGVMLVVLAVACGSDKESKSNDTDNDSTPVATKKATKAAVTKEATEEVEVTKEPDEDDGAASGVMEPLSFLTSGMFGGEVQGSVTGAADSELADMLIASTDLPGTFAGIGGDMGFSMEMPEGPITMAMRTFSEGDPNMAEMAPTVISAAMLVPPEVLEEFDSGLSELEGMTTEEIQETMGGASMMGMEFKELDVGTIDLGDGGMRMHMVVDMSGMVEIFGDLGEEGELEGFPTALSFDMYIFKKGDVVLMAMTMLSGDEQSSVDIAELAEIMESRAP